MGWREFIQDYKIDHQHAPNNNWEIHCPFCGISDHGKHMGVSLNSSKFGCWRDESHVGVNPTRLIKALLDCDWKTAKQLSDSYFGWIHTKIVSVDHEQVPFDAPSTFIQFDGTMPEFESQFKSYLIDRGFTDPSWVIKRYQLRFAITGRHSFRLIIPIIENGKWYHWVGRAISDTEEQRYKAADKLDGVDNKLNKLILGYDYLKTGGDKLVVCEGTFDAMKIQSAFIPGVSATCLFGQNISTAQLQKILGLGFKHIIIGLDRDALAHSLRIKQRFEVFRKDNQRITVGTPTAKDWGEMSPKGLRDYFNGNH